MVELNEFEKENGTALPPLKKQEQVEAPAVPAPPIDVAPPKVMTPAKPKTPVKLTEEEIFKVDYFATKAENIGYRRQALQQAINDLAQEEEKLKADLIGYRQELGKRYDMDPTRLRIRKDGMMAEEPLPGALRPVPGTQS